MSLYEVIAIVLGWSAVAFVIATCWRRFHRRTPRSVMPPKCGCDACTRKAPVRGIVLEQQQLGEVQAGVYAVTCGAGHTAMLGYDYLNEDGPGRVVVVICNGAVFEQAVEPALKKHTAARAT